jgi:hypothetical protein
MRGLDIDDKHVDHSTPLPQNSQPILIHRSDIIRSIPSLLLLSLLAALAPISYSVHTGPGHYMTILPHLIQGLLLLVCVIPLPQPADGQQEKLSARNEVMSVLEMVCRALGLLSWEWARLVSSSWTLTSVLGNSAGPLICWAGIAGLALLEFVVRMVSLISSDSFAHVRGDADKQIVHAS